MTVILVLLTAIVCLLIEFLVSRSRPETAGIHETLPLRATFPRLVPAIVSGFEVPDNLRFHPGHSWALRESPDLVRAGLDHFAAKLVGKIEAMKLPRRGQWIRQGQKVWSLLSDGNEVELASPVEGIVTDINESALRNPDLALSDPYGEGWLMTVRSPDAATNFRNLLGGTLARRWMEEAADRLRGRLQGVAGATAADGGVAISDIRSRLSAEAWEELVREFFLL